MKKYIGLVVLTLVLIKLGDWMLIKVQKGPYRADDGFLLDHEYVYYPYTGFHVPSNFQIHRKKESVLLDLEDLDIRTGDRGFLVDFDLDNPPKKEPDEFRIILTGGSSAQGFGSRSTDLMFHKVLEDEMNSKLSSLGVKKRVRVINLAMAGSNSYQNFIALNLWGHALEPDLILTLSGFVDAILDTDMFLGGYQIGGFIESRRRSNMGFIRSGLATLFPGMFRHSVLGQALQAMGMYDATMKYRQKYDDGKNEAERERGKMLFYARAMESITRDFPDTPLVMVTQPSAPEPKVDQFFDEVRKELADEVTKGRIIVLDARSHWTKNANLTGTFVDDRHFSPHGNRVLASFVQDSLIEVVRSSLSSRKRH